MSAATLSWAGIVRLGLIQAAIGALVVLATSTMNRIMVVELALPAIVPGALVALHYLVQMTRPRFGHGSDTGGRLARWIIGGMAVLAVGAVAAAAGVMLMASDRRWGLALAVTAFATIGLGVGASGTSLLVLLAQRVEPRRRAAAATIAWILMIAGFVLTTAFAGQLLEPYSHARLLLLTAVTACVALLVTFLALRGVEAGSGAPLPAVEAHGGFRAAVRQVWAEPVTRRFTFFVFVSMLAYSGQELIFEPFAGFVFQLTPAQSARLASLQHGGALLGMIAVACVTTWASATRFASLRAWTVAGCVGSCVALLGFFAASQLPAWPLHANAFMLGLLNGAFTVSAIGSMMALASADGTDRQGVRMGLWGAAQAVAFALGGLCSSAAADLARSLLGSPLSAYTLVFAAQAALFLAAAAIAGTVGGTPARRKVFSAYGRAPGVRA